MDRFPFYLPPYQKEKLEERKKKTGVSISQQIRNAINDFLKKNEDGK